MQKLAAKLVKGMHEVAYIAKNGNNEYHGYSYATSADVLQKVNAALTKYNICSVAVPALIGDIEVVTNKGNKEHLVTVKMDIILTDADSGETVTITGLGSGQDNGDKAVMKAQTASIKYAYLLSMATSTGDDPEGDSKTDENMNLQGEVRRNSTLKDKLICNDCQTKITTGVMNVSISKYGRPLCMKCQKKRQAIA